MFFDYETDTAKFDDNDWQMLEFLRQYAGGYGLDQQNPGQIAQALVEAGFSDISETDISAQTKPTFDRLRQIARPFAWIKPGSKLAPHFVNAVMASHGYSNLYESGEFRYLIYRAQKER